MRLVDSLKHGQEKLESINLEWRGKVESTLRHWPETFNKKVADIRNISLPWTQYLQSLNDSADEQATPLSLSPQLAALYARLEPELGEETFIGDWLAIDQSFIDRFADVTGDQQWIHTDPGRAMLESPFKTTIAHGFLTLSLIPLLTNSVASEKSDYPEARLVVNYGINRVIFPSPVKAGKRIRARTRVIALNPLKRGLELTREVKIEIEDGHRPACIAEMVLRLYD